MAHCKHRGDYVVPFPEQPVRPANTQIFALLDKVQENDLDTLFNIAATALVGAQCLRTLRRPNPPPSVYQGLMNGLATACFALALAIGIPRDSLTDLPAPTSKTKRLSDASMRKTIAQLCHLSQLDTSAMRPSAAR